MIYREAKYLVFDDGRQAEEGDYVLHPFFGDCGRIVKVYVHYDYSDYDFMAIEGVRSLLMRKLGDNVVAAKWKELRDEDKERLDENTVCFVTEEKGQLKRYEDGKVMLTFT